MYALGQLCGDGSSKAIEHGLIIAEKRGMSKVIEKEKINNIRENRGKWCTLLEHFVF